MTRSVLITLVAVVCSATRMQASPIAYTLATTATGTLGGSSFTNALVTVTLIGDTANVVPGTAPFVGTVANSGTATVNVAGIGTGTFTDQIQISSSLNDAAALALFGGPGVLIIDSTTNTGIVLQLGSAFSTYNLRSSLGPLSGSGGPASGSHVTPIFPTTSGNFTWAVGQPLGSSTFTAVATPEPTTLLLLGSGLAAMFVRNRFRQQQQ